ncbi:DNA replication/repair protein RecF [Neolewinella lacunae]|uniref:DNA replication and repair protein RecF n=1 Tax=Neolewinella lacunae TaxID=1517758 RepID=A0A923T7A8_9BACT|nr:DNA replication/repair protein RecF [Neolewinella lacunae]MBC6992653.1 DNA replication/repair protein RecF [Neolewinella lacunae]MDN3633533.1 DNA replication/repair protein RecF [Neolewinella lacunae]
MYLSSLTLTQFKNYGSQQLELSPRLNCFVGPNGAGKTNLLEAVYYLCMGKSHTGNPDQYAIRHGEDGSRLEGIFLLDASERDKTVVKLRKRQRKVIERNGTPYDRLADHVGRYPVVIIVPDDSALVLEGSEVRRRLIDNSLSQTDPAYLNHLIHYNRLLANRNALLKELAGRSDTSGLLSVYDQQLEPAATYLHQRRQSFSGPFTELLLEAYAAISGEKEQVELRYKSQLEEQSWAALMEANREKDRVLQRTTAGIHRDDLVFSQDGHPLRRVASQGQLKSFVLSLKLAQYRLLERDTQRTPILLLDDIFDKLDQDRVRQLLTLVLGSAYGQVFISDTDPERVTQLIEGNPALDWRRFLVADGRVTG